MGGLKCHTRNLGQLIHILLKSFLKHIKSFICDNFNFIIKCSREVDKDTEKVTFDVISLHTQVFLTNLALKL